jgi:hypothetical protein
MTIHSQLSADASNKSSENVLNLGDMTFLIKFGGE